MANVFISYSRKDRDFVRAMHEALEKRGFDAWVDWEGIPPTADWLQEIYAGIKSADTFVAVLSPDFSASEICRLEVQHAARHNKRVVPVVCRDVDPREVPPELARHNWLFVRPEDDFQAGVETLADAINTDLDWAREHTRLLVRATEWEERERDDSLLLRGADLREAETWLSQANAEKSPGPTALHARYVLASRKAERNKLRLTAGLAVLIMLIAIGLALYALSERNQAVREASVRATAEAISETRRLEAERQQKIATSRQLAAQSLSRLSTQLDLSLLLSIEANRITDTVEAKGSLLEGLQYTPHLSHFLRGHTSAVQSVAASFSTAATGGDDNSIIFWDIDTGEQRSKPLKVLSSTVVSLAFSPGGETLAAGDQDGSIVLLSTSTHEPVNPTLPGDFGGAQQLVFSLDGKVLASFGSGPNVTLWNLASSEPVSQTYQVNAPIFDVAFTPDGKAIAAATFDKSILLWDVVIGKALTTALIGHEGSVGAAAFNFDGSLLASSDAGSIIIWDVASRKPFVKPLTLPSGSVTALTLDASGRLLASADQRNVITLWDIIAGVPLGSPFRGHSSIITDLAFSGLDGDRLISGSWDGTAIIWSVSKDQTLGERFAEITSPGTLFSIAFSPDGKTIASGSEDSVTLWDVATRARTGPPYFAENTGWVRSVAFSPDGKWLASGGEDRSVVLWDVTTKVIVGQTKPEHKDGVLGVAFSPDSKLLASASRDKTIILWEVPDREPTGAPLAGHTDTVTSVAFSPDGKLLASGSWDNTIILWDVATRKQLGEPLKGHTDDVWSVAFSPDGSLLASAGEDLSIILWDVATRKPIGQPLTGHVNTIMSVAFSPDGKLLASGSTDNTIALWDVASRWQIKPNFDGQEGIVYSVAFSPDGKFLASGEKNSPTLWDVNLDSWQEHACLIAARNLTQDEWQRYMGDEPYRKSCPSFP
ncbi:MAG TPA: TIR domain-containing protein [Chloroflexia bacterium]|nr:TIR domain-containing protein [Chloroflexia bacterium]